MARRYYLAQSLVVLRDEINTLWPNRSKVSDGWIGDAAHSARTSDHNPNARGSVNALDVTRNGIDTAILLNATIGDPRVNYVIFNRKIWSRSRNWVARTYSGANPHTGHVHVSLLQTQAAETNTSPWGIATRRPTPKPPGTGAPGPTPTTPKGLFPMSDTQFNALMAEIKKTSANTSTAFGPLGGREYIQEVSRSAARAMWDGSYVTRAGKPVHTKQELADTKSNTILILSELRAQRDALSQALSGQGVDMDKVQSAAKDGAADALHTHEQTMKRLLETLELELRATIIEAVNEIDAGLVSADPERFANDILQSLSDALDRNRSDA